MAKKGRPRKRIGEEYRIDRYCFLLDLQDHGFWRDLNTVWRDQETLDAWKERYCVVDEWLVKIVSDSLEYWETFPESDLACLKGKQWFDYRAVGLPRTHQILERKIGAVLFHGGSLGRREIESYIAEHRRMILDHVSIVTGFSQRSACSWTARYQTGSTYTQIARDTGFSSYDEEYVGRTVRKFARRIGLTLRSCVKRDPATEVTEKSYFFVLT